jgi:hypothetical protein
MELAELEPRLTRFVAPRSFHYVRSLAKADSLWFLCPACFIANKGKVGTHGIRIDFVGRGVPDEMCLHNDQGKPVRWNMTGTSLKDISLTPSILILSGCKWHGYVTNGAIVTV